MRFCDLRQGMSWLIIVIISGLSARAQDLTPWTSNPYGNQWIDYSKKYVRVGVQTNGIYKVSYSSLATALQKDGVTITPEKIQLWHRGQQVAILSANSTEVVFYGEKNDGASDGLMFRPGPEARLNTYSSFFSEEGSYFFTVADSPLRSAQLNAAPVSSVTPEAYHFETFLKKFDDYDPASPAAGRRLSTQKFSFSTGADDATLNQSYYTEANAWTGPIIYGPNAMVGTSAGSPTSYSNTFTLKNFVNSAGVNPVFSMGVHGHSTGQHIIKVNVSNALGDIDSKEIGSSTFSGYGGSKISSDLALNTNVATDGTVNVKVKSISASTADYFGISFYTVTYPQTLNVNGVNSALLNFKASSGAKSIIPITGASAGTVVYDISDPYKPVALTNGTFDSGTSTLTVEVSRTSGAGLKLFIVNPAYSIASLSSIKNVNFQPIFEKANNGVSARTPSGAINPAAFDYLIITNDDTDPSGDPERDLRSGAIAYARDFRTEQLGGSYSALVMDIRTIYDQFNYGEPSAMAIRRFVDYMIQNGKRPKHNLLLLGISVSLPRLLIKEMPGEVPTFGDPGSDILLVAGLTNSPNQDLPAIPIGRIVAFNKTELANYQAKIIEYQTQTNESTEESLAWRKKVVHLVGAQFQSELAEFKGVFTGVESYVKSLDNTRSVKTISNDAAANSNTVVAQQTTAPMAAEVNPGVGMIAYYGHGAQNSTIYNIGKVSESAYGYTANHKYPVIYFNGCGVGNEFTARNTHSISADWIAGANKGAIAIICNSYKSYVSPTKIYINQLYQQIFLSSDANRKTAGQIVVDMGYITINGAPSTRVLADQFQITNIHQTNLYGDPALLILNSKPASSLPVTLIKFTGKAEASGSVSLKWTTTSEVNNSHFDVERSYDARNFETIGRIDGKGTFEGVSSYDFLDDHPFDGTNYYRLRQVDFAGNSDSKESMSQIVSVKVETSKLVVIQPNPVISEMEIRLDGGQSLQSWQLFNQKGQLVKSGLEKKVDVNSLSSGMYVISITTSKGVIVKRSVIKK